MCLKRLRLSFVFNFSLSVDVFQPNEKSLSLLVYSRVAISDMCPVTVGNQSCQNSEKSEKLKMGGRWQARTPTFLMLSTECITVCWNLSCQFYLVVCVGWGSSWQVEHNNSTVSIVGRCIARSIHRKVDSLQGRFITESIHRGQFFVGRFIAGSIHRRVNSSWVDSSQGRFILGR
jgi:hypothetical protein